MDDNEKASRVLAAAHELENGYEDEGKPALAKQVRDGFAALPVGSLAKLFDILTKQRD